MRAQKNRGKSPMDTDEPAAQPGTDSASSHSRGSRSSSKHARQGSAGAGQQQHPTHRHPSPQRHQQQQGASSSAAASENTIKDKDKDMPGADDGNNTSDADDRENLASCDAYYAQEQLERIRRQQKKQKMHDAPAAHAPLTQGALSFSDAAGDAIDGADIAAIDVYRLALQEQQRRDQEGDRQRHFDLVKKLFASALGKFEAAERAAVGTDKAISTNTITYANCLRDFAEWVRSPELLVKAKTIYDRVIEVLGQENSIETALALIGYSKVFFLEIRFRFEDENLLSTSDEDEEKHLKKDENERRLRESSDDSYSKYYVSKEEETKFRDSMDNFRRALKIFADQGEARLFRENTTLIVNMLVDYYFLHSKLKKKSMSYMKNILQISVDLLAESFDDDSDEFEHDFIATELWGTCLYYLASHEANKEDEIDTSKSNLATSIKKLKRARSIERKLQLQPRTRHLEMLGQAYILLSTLELSDEDAMSAYEEGRNAFRDALKIDPDNDAIKEQLETMEIGAEEIMEGV